MLSLFGWPIWAEHNMLVCGVNRSATVVHAIFGSSPALYRFLTLLAFSIRALQPRADHASVRNIFGVAPLVLSRRLNSTSRRCPSFHGGGRQREEPQAGGMVRGRDGHWLRPCFWPDISEQVKGKEPR